MPRPRWLRSHASKPALCDMPSAEAVETVPRCASSSLTCASCSTMLAFSAFLSAGALPSVRSKAPSPNDCANSLSAPPVATRLVLS